jgi:hypothetical protein
MFRRLRPLFVLALPALLVACPRPTLPPPPVDPVTPEQQLRAQVEALTERTRALLRMQDELVWAHWTTGAEVDFSVTAAEEKDLYTEEALGVLSAAGEATDDLLDARALEQLRLHFVGELLARAAAAETAAAARAEATFTFQVAGQDHTLRDVDRLLARERNALRRQALHTQAGSVASRLTPLLDAREARLREAAQALGYPDLVALAGALRRTDLEALAAQAERLLVLSAPAFRAVLDQQAPRALRLPRDRLRLRDLPRAFRAPHVDEHFPAEALLTRSEQTLAGLSIPAPRRAHVRLDAAHREGKNPRPLALAVVVPEDVRLSVVPLPGVRVQAGYLRELGHALHAACTLQPRFALSKLGGGAVPEAWSLLFERLTQDPAWLERTTKLNADRAARYLSSAAAWELYLLRRSAAQVLYEYRRLQPGADERAVYRAVLEEAFLLPVEDADVARHALGREELFASARPFEAQLLAHALEVQLQSRFGPSWWERPEAGAWLQQLWAHGNALDARELAAAAGAGALSPEGLVLRLNLALRTPGLEPEEE